MAPSALPSMPKPGRFSARMSGKFVRFALGSLIAMAAPAMAAHGAGKKDPPPAAMGYSSVPTQATDRFVNGKYDKTGVYVPPHYEAAPKPAFHGYFFKKPVVNKDQKPN